MTDSLISISSGALTARINPFGAELWSLADAAGGQYMTAADPAFWTGHAPILFPIVGGLVDDAYRLDGVRHVLPRHGFARRSLFTLARQAADEVAFVLRADEATRATYPFDFELEMAYRLEGSTLTMTGSVRHLGEGEMPFSFGYHPAFAWPLPGGAAKEAHVIRFAEDEPAPVRRVSKTSGQFLPSEEASPVVGRDLALDEDLFAADAVIWIDMASRALRYGAPGGASLDIAYPDTPYLGLWQPVGAQFLCIEPWAGYADPVGFSGDFRDKPGIQSVAAGETAQFRMVVTVNPA